MQASSSSSFPSYEVSWSLPHTHSGVHLPSQRLKVKGPMDQTPKTVRPNKPVLFIS